MRFHWAGAFFHLFFFLLATDIAVNAQVSGDEWIRPGQSYYKIKTAQNGIYRITYDQLGQAGLPLASIDPEKLQLFHRGEEQAIRIIGEGDGQFDPDDYLEFYGRVNDGTLEQELYITPDAQPHGYHNLYSDTTAYFLTWRLDNFSGKRMAVFSASNPPALTPEPYHWQEELQLFTSDYSVGREYPEGTSGYTWLSQFDYGEGFTGARIRKNEFNDFEFTGLNHFYQAGPKPRLEIVLAGRNNAIHQVEISVGSSGSLSTWASPSFNYFDTHLVEGELEWSDLASGTLTVRVAVNNQAADFVSVTYIKVTYPQTFDLAGAAQKILTLPGVNNVLRELEVLDPPVEPTLYQITDPNNVSLINYTVSGNLLKASVPSGPSAEILWLESREPMPITAMEKIDFQNFNAADYLIVSHRSLMKPAGKYGDAAAAYAEYRTSPQGGSHNTLLVDINRLYDQFNYGEVSPLAIRRFVAKMLALGQPKYLLLLGKSFNLAFKPYRVAGSLDLVPTSGFPGSDIALTAGLNGSGYGAAIPTGRINARIPEDVIAYLDKVKEKESMAPNQPWSKNIIHLSGGINTSELSRFKNYVNDFAEVAEGPYLGASVTTINKQSNETVVLINIAEEVNKGVGMITFFGHSAPEITDIEIGDASDPTLGYENQGRYPMILVSGCNAGNIFGNAKGFGEDWIVTPNKGALGFVAHAAFGFENNLKRYADKIYQTAYGDSAFIHMPMGDILAEASRRYLQEVSVNVKHITQIQQTVFQGDPAVRFFGTNQPDYETSDEQLFLEPFPGQELNALADSFQLGVIARNLGLVTNQPLNLGVRRTLSDGRIINYDSVFYPPIKNEDTLFFTIRSNEISSFGDNRFEVALDFASLIDESDETNNSGTLNAFIPLGGTVNLSPRPFAIVHQQSVPLLVQSSDLLSGTRGFLFELDTVHTFNSPWLQTRLVEADALAQWEVSLLADDMANDSTVYYWRTKLQSPGSGEDTTWARSSFIYINESPEGWSQSALPQFEVDITEGIARNGHQGIWEFSTTDTRLQVTTFGTDHPEDAPVNIKVDIGGQSFIVGNRLCRTNSMNAVAFDQSTTIPYPVITKPGFDVLDPNRCGRAPQVINNFRDGEILSSGKLEEYLDLLPVGDYAVLFSMGTVSYQSWPQSLLDKLQTIGVNPDQIATLANGEPLIIFGQKGGGPGSVLVKTANPSSGVPLTEQRLDLDQVINGAFSKGSITSPRIGPALSWGTLYKTLKPQELPDTDEVQFEVIGLDQFGQETVLINQVGTDVYDLSGIDAQKYPYIQLRVRLIDEVNLTPAQLAKWQVIYEPAPEGVLLFRGNDQGFVRHLQLEQGAPISSRFVFKNVSDQTFADSILVQYRWFNRQERRSLQEEIKLGMLAPGDSAEFAISANTFEDIGSNDLRVYANPQIIPERIFNNNIIDLQEYLLVNQDATNPILDVTFDHRYITDGDYVAPDPLIQVVLKEDNPFVFKQDTAGMELFMKLPGCATCDFEPIYFSNPRVTWSPATATADFKIEFMPGPLENGSYTLKVQGEDVFGKPSGSEPYIINFEVINAATITHIQPYPNPFKKQVHFAMALTGGQAIDQIKIRIIDLAGQVVREIGMEEMNPISTGSHVVYYVWDGTNASGAPLSNGIYLYQLSIDAPGFTFKSVNGGQEKAFTHGFGKLYLLK